MSSNEPVIETSDILLLSAICFGLLGLIYFKWRTKQLEKNGTSERFTGSADGGAKTHLTEKTSSGKLSLLYKLQKIPSAKKAVLFYGSQTGTAEDFCQRFATELSSNLGIPALVCDAEAYDAAELPLLDSSCLLGFFLASYGEGEPTDNAVDLFEFVMGGPKAADESVDGEGEDQGCLSHLSYVMFGLGNRTYEYYNTVATMVDQRMRLWGHSTRLGELGLGDDAGSIEDDFNRWSAQIVREAVCPFFGLDPDKPEAFISDDAAPVPLFHIEFEAQASNDSLFHGEVSGKNVVRKWSDGKENSPSGMPFRYDPKYPFYASLVSSKQLFQKDPKDCFGAFESGATLVNNQPSSCSASFSGTDGKNQVQVERECLHLEFDLGSSNLRYETGDHVGVLAYNSDEAVLQLVEALKLPASTVTSVFKLEANMQHPMAFNAKIIAPYPCTVWTALKFYSDLGRVLNQFQLSVLAKYARNAETKQLLKALVSDKALYTCYVYNPRKNLAEVVAEIGADNLDLPLSTVLGELLHAIPVRYYSISSSSRATPRIVSVTAATVRYAIDSPAITPDILTRPLGFNHNMRAVVKQGLATGMLSEIHARMNGKFLAKAETLTRLESLGVLSEAALFEKLQRPPFSVPILLRRSKFKLPRKSTVPVVMVGPGTGVAPFRGFIHDRVTQLKKKLAIGTTVLFFGCRNKEKEFIYADEWLEFGASISDSIPLQENRAGQIAVVTAFSRDGPQKVYVQHRLRDSGAEIWRLLSQERGYFFICGDALHMAVDVQNALVDIAREHGSMTEIEGETWVKKLRLSGRFFEDVWS